MGKYTGVITLTEYIPPQLDGKNIEGVKNLYALSSDGETPPEEGEVEILVDQETLSVEKEEGEIFDVTNSKVNVLDSGFFYIQNTSKLVILDNIWMNSTPKNVKGMYLWTKTQFDYTNDEADITYTVSYIGADGQAGLDANPYVIDTNCEEILIFESKNSTSAEYEHEYSPGSLNFTVYNNKGEEQKEIILTKYNYKLEHLLKGKFEEVPWEYITFGIQSTQSLGSEETLNLDIEKYAKEFSVGPSLVFRFSYMDGNRVLQRKVIPVRFGVSQEMAKLNINAAGITASIEEGNLEFSKDGLTYTNEGEKVFAVGGTGNVFVKGSIYATDGVFNGTVYAENGVFNGKIQATSGVIGGFNIGLDVLNSIKTFEGTEEGENIPCIKLDGENGTVYAKNLTIGDGAEIENFIKLGQAKILNPEKNNGTILQSGKIILNDSGKLKIGNIILSGDPANNYITAGASSNNSESGITANWIIRGDGTSEFREIIADKITIKDSIMEIGTVQGMSGIMLFKDSWRISTIEPVEGSTNIKCTLELSSSKQGDGEILAKPLLEKNDYLLANHNTYYKVVGIEEDEPYKVTLSTNGKVDIQNGDVLVKIGKNKDYLITVQGDSADHRQDSGHRYSTPYSLTMSTIVVEDGDSIPSYDKQLVLGDLSTITDKMEGITGTGLYAENVFLNGSLVTRTSNNTDVDGGVKYAGINTTTGAAATVFEENDNSKIVIWAGANGNNVEAIQKAKFQVTEEGSLYAAQGKFNGSLITDSVIKGSSLHTAKIFGEKEGERAALQIYDARNGIQFIKDRQSPQLINLESLNGKVHTSYGATFEYNALTGGIRIHGTPTGKGVSTTQNTDFTVRFDLEAGTYYIKNYYSGTSKNTTAYVKYLKDGSTTSYDYVRNKKFVLNEAKTVQVYFRVEDGVTTTLDEIIFPMLVKGASPEPWAPFVGDTEEVLLEIATEGLSLGLDSNENKNYFIKIFEDSTNKKTVDYFGNSLTLSGSKFSLLAGSNYIESNSISDGEAGTKQKLEFKNGFQFIEDENTIFEIKNGYIKGSQKAIFGTNVIFGEEDGAGVLEYKKITNENSSGYDLYVR